MRRSPARSNPGRPAPARVGSCFSSRRYELWFTRGAAHNAPVVNGVEQKDGRQFEATGVAFADKGTSQRLSMNIEKAYPPEAGLKSLRREIDVRRAPSMTIDVRDTAVMSAGGGGAMRYTFYTVAPARQAGPGRLSIATAPRSLQLEFQPATATVTVEPVDLQDPIMKSNWGPRLYRVVIEAAGSSAVSFRFAAEPKG